MDLHLTRSTRTFPIGLSCTRLVNQYDLFVLDPPRLRVDRGVQHTGDQQSSVARITSSKTNHALIGGVIRGAPRVGGDIASYGRAGQPNRGCSGPRESDTNQFPGAGAVSPPAWAQPPTLLPRRNVLAVAVKEPSWLNICRLRTVLTTAPPSPQLQQNKSFPSHSLTSPASGATPPPCYSSE